MEQLRSLSEVRNEQSRIMRDIGGLLQYWLREHKNLTDAEIKAFISNTDYTLTQIKEIFQRWNELEKEEYEIKVANEKKYKIKINLNL